MPALRNTLSFAKSAACGPTGLLTLLAAALSKVALKVVKALRAFPRLRLVLARFRKVFPDYK